MSWNKFPWSNMHGFNMDWIIETVESCKTLVDGIVEEVNSIFSNYVTKDDLKNNRKLDESGNFTGTWGGDSKSEIDAEIANGQALYQNVLDLIESNPQLNITVEDGGYLASSIAPTIIDGGLITDPVTEEVDGGYLVPPCNCIG